jgi:hypothetical protein
VLCLIWSYFSRFVQVLLNLPSQTIIMNQWTGGVEMLVWYTGQPADPGITDNQEAEHSFKCAQERRVVDTHVADGSPAGASGIRRLMMTALGSYHFPKAKLNHNMTLRSSSSSFSWLLASRLEGTVHLSYH